MKLNKKNIILASILGLTLISSNFNLSNAQELSTEPKIHVSNNIQMVR